MEYPSKHQEQKDKNQNKIDFKQLDQLVESQRSVLEEKLKDKNISPLVQNATYKQLEKLDAITSQLLQLETNGHYTFDKAEEVVGTNLVNLSKRIGQVADTRRQEGMMADAEKLQAVLAFIREQKDKVAVVDKREESAVQPKEYDIDAKKKELDEVWKKSQEIQAKRRLETQSTNKAIEQVRKEIGIESPEQEANKEQLMKSILEDGGFRAHAALSKEVSGLGSSGFYSLESRVNDHRYPSSAIGEAAQRLLTRSDRGRFSENIQGMREVLAEHGISEMLDVQKEQTQEYDQVIIPGKKGILGFGATPDRTEQKPTGRYRSLLHSELVQGGKSEPAVRFSYIVSARNREWRSSDGRGGQMLSLEVILPESVAKEFETAAERDPKLVRDMVEKIMKEKILKKPEEWDKPQFKGSSGDSDGSTTIRPPYEQWDKANGGARVYIQKAGKEPGFHQEFVHEIK